MSFFARLGKSKHSYKIVVTIEKIQLNLAASVKMQVVLKRGDKVRKTKTQPQINKGMATFLEDLVVPATMYYDKKKKSYMEKVGDIELYLVTKGGHKKVGVSKIDFGNVLNENIDTREKRMKIPIEKCIDKKAQFHLKVAFIGGPSGVQTRERSATTRKESLKLSKSRSKSKTEKRKKASESGSGASDGNSDNEESKYERKRKLSDDDSDEVDKFDESNYTVGRRKSRGMTKKRRDDSESDMSQSERSRARSEEIKHKGGFNDFFSSRTYNNNILTPNSEATISANHQTKQLEDKVTSLEYANNRYQKENQELLENLSKEKDNYRELKREYDDLVYQHERVIKEKDNVANDLKAKDTLDKRSEIEIKAQKANVQNLEHQIRQLEQEKRKAKDQYDDLRKTNDDLQRKVDFYKSEDKKQEQMETLEITRLRQEIDDLLQKNSKNEAYFRQAREGFEKRTGETMQALIESEDKNNQLQLKIIRLEADITNLTGNIEILRKEVANSKKLNDLSFESHKRAGGLDTSNRFLDTIDEVDDKHKKIEESYKKKIEELLRELSQARSEAGKTVNSNMGKKYETDSEIAIMSLENESLKKQMKELTAKIASKKEDNKEGEYKAKILELEDERVVLENQISKLKLKVTTLEKELDNNQKIISESEENNNTRQQQLTETQQNYFILKSQIAQIMNTCADYDQDGSLLDAIEKIITQ